MCFNSFLQGQVSITAAEGPSSTPLLQVQGLLWLWLPDPAEVQVLQKKGLQACRTLDQGSVPPNSSPTWLFTSVPLLCRAWRQRSAPFCKQCLPEQGVKVKVVLLCAPGSGWNHPCQCDFTGTVRKQEHLSLGFPCPSQSHVLGTGPCCLFASVC